MTSRFVKLMLGFLVVLAVSFAFAAKATAAPPAGLNWEVHGTGSGGVSLLTGGSSGGPAMPQHIGNATYSLSIATPAASSSNGAGGFCAIATGSGAITAADGSTIFFLTVGLLCNESGALSPLHYNATYRITGGDGRFFGVLGGGSLTATFGSPHFIKIDGTITGI
ncbi:MAG: hypothetical protein E6G99_11680 [Bacillati bacterium ANGP1]|uniref:Uncharacterized protein n=1 Tax=Candidatus Segetimicrobium genomatis TaxID=2569760 RepID=A0A537L522_9BACT|nr:MAG: hypothetical protein E6G99_11680 [Terrabacteria group bacterium ANGP1]TMJ09558.1 MAG: hypothetical protein E6G98_09165 [Terrabacteria group bacterium ANGP1]